MTLRIFTAALLASGLALTAGCRSTNRSNYPATVVGVQPAPRPAAPCPNPVPPPPPVPVGINP